MSSISTRSRRFVVSLVIALLAVMATVMFGGRINAEDMPAASSFAFIDSAAEFFGLRGNSVSPNSEPPIPVNNTVGDAATGGVFAGTIDAKAESELKSRPQGNEYLKLNGTFEIPGEASLRNSPAISMIVSDLDGDGINDLITGRRNGVSIQMGDINAFAPQTQAAFEAIRDLRFISPFKQDSRTIELPIRPDFLLSGDFDRDSRMDIAAAARGGTSIYLIEGDGSGVREIQPTGRITSLASGDTNRLDGLPDIIAGLDNDGISSLSIYQGLGDIFNAAPETIELASPATQILTGQFDESTFSDIAVTSRNQLIIFSGHDTDSKSAEPLYLRQGFNISGMAVGDFIPDRDYRSEFALLGDDGDIRILSRGDLDTRPVTKQELLAIEALGLRKQGMPIPQRIIKQIDLADLKEKPDSLSRNAATWSEADSFFGATPGEAASSGAILTSARLSNRAGDDLILIDGSNKSVIAMPLIVNDDGEKGVRTDYTGKRQAIRFELDGAPISIAADRLNFDGEKDLIILEEGKSSPTTLISAPLAAFTVNSAGDQVDANPGNGVCATAGAVCTLRAAIMEANHLPGTDSITINPGINITLSTGSPDNDANGVFNFEGGGDLDITCAVNAGGDTCNAPLATNVNNLTITGAAGGNTIAVGAFAPFAPLTSTTDRVFDIGFDGLFGGGFGAGTGLQVTMSNLTIQSGNVREDFNAGGGGFGNFARGGAIRLDGFGQAGTRGTLTLTSVTINNNQADHNSGGIFNQFSNVSISSSTVSNNIGRAGPGGGLQFAASTPATLSVSGSTFSGNEARTGPIFTGTAIDVDGGGIYATLDNNTATITSTNFTNNISHDDGGAVYVASGATTVTGGTQSGNTARDDGGAFAGDNDTVSALRFMTLSGATMQNNRANSDNSGGGDGGAIFRDRGTLNVTNCMVGGVAALQPNNAVNGGGIAHAFRAAVTPSNQTTINIDNGSITGNNATTNGGGVFINATNQNVGTPSVLNVGSTTNVSVTENNSNVHGGGFAISGNVTANITRATIHGNDADKDNNATGDGGGIFHNNNGGTLTIPATVTIGTAGQGNTGENGGAIHHSVGTLNLTGTGIASNTTDIHGGGLFVSGGIVNVNGVTFAANTSTSGTEVRLTGGTTNFSNTITIPGELSIAGGTLSAGSSTVNLGEDFHFSSGTFTAGTSSFNFNGTVAQQIYGGATPTFNNIFDLNTASTLTINNNTVGSNATVNANATLLVAATRTLTVSGTLTNNGTIKGTGTIANNFSNAGIVAPGLSPGILSVTGTYANPGALNIEIGGTAGAGFNPNGHDELLVSGAATLGGTLNVTLTNGFTPALGNSFTILDAASSSGTFATINLPSLTTPNTWFVSYNNVAGTVTLVVVQPPTIVKSFVPNNIALSGTNQTASTLTLVLTNPNPSLALSGIAFTDTLTGGLQVDTTPTLSNGCGGVFTPALAGGQTALSYSGGSISAGGSCTISFRVNSTSLGTKTNATSGVASTEAGTGVVSNTATLNVLAAPSFTKTFGAASITVGGTTSLTFNITNNDTTFGLSGISFTDTLPAGLTVSTSAPTATCGGTLSTTAPGTITFSGGTLAASGTCSFNVTVTGATAGTKPNSVSLTTTQTGTNTAPAIASIDVFAPPTISKSFAPGTIVTGQTSTLNITVTNPAANPGTLTGISFTDTLPAGITAPNSSTASCNGGTLAVSANVITLTGGSLASGANCVNAVTVTGALASVTAYTNTINSVSSANGGTNNTPATANITVNKANTSLGSVSDAPDPSVVGQPYTVGFVLSVTAPGSATPTAPTGTVTVSDGTDQCIATLPATSCILTSTTAGNKTLTVTYSGDGNFNTSMTTAGHAVLGPPTVMKSFAVPSVPLGQNTTMSFQISNPNTGGAFANLTGIGFQDALPAGITVVSAASPQCGGTVATTPSSVTFSGGSLLAGATCTVAVTVNGAQTGSWNNTATNVVSTQGGPGVNSNTATLVVVAPPVIGKAFVPANTVPGGNSTLTFTINNPAANTVALTGVAFTDTFAPAGITVAATPNITPVANQCGAGSTVTAAGGSGTITLAGGTIAPGGSCTFSVDVTATTGGTNSVQVTSANGGTGNTATATLTTCIAPPLNMKAWYTGDTTLRDIAGGYDAASGGSPATTYAVGKVGQAFDLNGTSQWIERIDTTGMDTNPAAFSFDAWIFREGKLNLSAHEGLIVKMETSPASADSLGVFIQDTGAPGPTQDSFFVTYGGNLFNTANGSVPAINTWFHYAQTYDGANIRVYINGTLIATQPFVGRTASTGPLYIGGRAAQHSFNGQIDEVEVFNAVLTPAQITSIFTADSGGKCKPSDLRVDKAHSVTFTQGAAASYTVVVSNDGPTDTSGTTTMTDTLPAGLVPGTPTAPSGWTCPAPVGQAVSCTSTNVVASGGAFPTITIPVTVAQNAALLLDNTATVSGGGEMDTSDDSDTDPTTIIGVAQTPSVTNAATVHGAQTTSGLVITPNATDGAEVTHFKITNILNGTLFQNNGTTPIAAGSFITVAQGGPTGLRFTPNLGFVGNATFDIQASISNVDAGLGGSVITATIVVGQANTVTTITSDNPDPSVFGGNVVVNFTVVPQSPGMGVPAGNVVVTVSGGAETCTGTVASGTCTLALNGVGPRTLTATYAGNTFFIGSSDTEAHQVNQAATTTTITTDNPDPSVTGQNVTVNFTVTANAPGSGTPTGNVNVTVSGGSETCTGTVAAGSCVIALNSAGTRTLTASYLGDTNFTASSDTETHTVNKADSTTIITADAPDPTVVGQPYSVGVSVNVVAPGVGVPGGSVSVSDGTGGTCNITLAGGTGSCNLTSTSPGTKNLVATYAGDANFNGSTSPGASHTVNQAPTSFTAVGDTPDPTSVDQAYTVSWTVAVTAPGAGTPTGTVTVSDGTGDTCMATLPATSCTLNSLTQGVKTLTYTYSGDTNFVGSTNNATTHTVNCTPNPVVQNSSDAGTGSLRKAVADACSAVGQNTITFAPAVTNPITVATEIAIDKDLNIIGSGVSTTIVQAAATPFTTNHRIFNIGSVTPASNVTISSITMRNGAMPGFVAGGAILNTANLTLSTVLIAQNSAAFGGGIGNGGTVVVNNSTIAGNSAGFDGGGLNAFGPGTVSNSTFSGNTAGTNGGGISIDVMGQTVTIQNSTVTNNTATLQEGGGVHIFRGTGVIKSSIVALNTNSAKPDVSEAATVVFTGTFVSQGFNLIGKNNGSPAFTLPTDQTGTIASPLDPRIAPLSNNGGPTQTHALCIATGVPHASCTGLSPAIDKGKDFVLTGFDQRGSGPNFVRPFDLPDATFPDATGGDGSDIGAYELNNTPPMITPLATARQAGSPGANSQIATASDIETPLNGLTLAVNGGATATVNGVTVTLTDSNAGAGGINPNGTGQVFADVVAACGATTAMFTLTVTDDGGLPTNATLTVTVTANAPPVVTYNNPAAVVFGQSGITVSPAAPPADNGSITGYSILSVMPPLVASPTVNGSGVVSINNAGPVGNHVITVRSTDNCGAVTDSPFTLTVNPADTLTTVQTAMNPPVYGQTTTITATVTAVLPGTGIPQGSVNFTDGGNPIPTCQGVMVNAFGAATCVVNNLGAGVNKVIGASYSGNTNYNPSMGTTLRTINPAPLQVTATSHVVTYGDAAPSITTVNPITGFVLGENSSVFTSPVTCSTTYVAGSNVSGSPYPTTCTGGAAANYSFNYVGGTVLVNRKALTVTADDKTRAYGAANPTLTAMFAGFVLGQNFATSGITGSAGLSTTATATSPVGPYPITVTLGTLASGNYSFASFTNGTLAVTAVQLTVTAENKTRVFGAANPTLTFTVTGFVNGEGLGALTGSPTISTTATATSPVGSYPITIAIGTLANPNYTFTFTPGTLTVTQAATTTTITNAAALGTPTAVGQAYAVNWTTSPVAPGAGTLTGNVTVMDGTGATCQAAVAVGTCMLTSTTVGIKTITANYPGDTNFTGSMSQAVQHTVVIQITGNVKQFVPFGTNTNLAGVTITLTGTATGEATTDANGNYTFNLLTTGGNYVITPSGLGKTYEPITRTYSNVTTNITGADFVAYNAPGPGGNPREVKVINAVATPGQPVTVPVEITSQGNETRLAFSLNYDVALLGVPTAVCGTGATGCAITVNNSLAGRVGITIVPTAALTAGTRQIARVTFPTFPTGALSTPVSFGDNPTTRDIRRADNNPLPALYTTGFVAFNQTMLGFEGDVVDAAGTNAGGDGVLSNDVTIERLLVLGLLTAVTTPNQYQRADAAPRTTLGDGCPINAGDVTQVARYNLGLDPPTTTGGPTTPIPGGCAPPTRGEAPDQSARIIRAVDTQTKAGQTVVVPIELDSQGDETSASYTVNFNPNVLTFVSAEIGTGVPTGADIGTNTTQTDEGKVGILVSTANTYAKGKRNVLNLTFKVAVGTENGAYPLTFNDTPTQNGVANEHGEMLTTTYEVGSIIIGNPTAPGVTVSGRVTTTTGQGLRNATVTITDANGNRRTTTTGSFGIYTFTDVEAGQSYVITVTSRRFRFAPRELNLTNTLTDVNFVGLE